MADKQYLDQEGLDRLVSYLHSSLDTKANIEDVPTREELNNYISEATGFIDENELQEALNNYVTNSELDNFKSTLSTVYHFRGTVDNLIALSDIENPEVGDVYNLADTGMNAAWTGEIWDQFGSITDLSDYLLIDDVNAIELSTIDSILYSSKRAAVSDLNGIKAMLSNNNDNIEIILNKDLELDTILTIPSNKSVIFNLGGNKITSDNYIINCMGGNITIKNGEIESNGRPIIASGGSLVTIDDTNIISKNDVGISVTGNNSKVVMNSGKITAQESGILVTTNAQLELNGGEIECFDNCPIQGNGTVKAGNDQGHINVVMNGGKIIAHIQSDGYIACGVYIPNSGKFVMNGGEIISEGAGLVMRAGEVELNAGSITATGITGSKGKVGDSRVVVGPYAVIYDESAKYPGIANGDFKLTIGKDMILAGTDGDLDVLLSEGASANIIDNR